MAETEKQARLARALRANLKRRKVQAREAVMKAPPPTAADEPANAS